MDKYTVINLKLKGESNRSIAKQIGIDRKTVARYWQEYQRGINELEEVSSGDDIGKLREVQEDIVSEMKYDSSTRKSRKYTPQLDAFVDKLLEDENRKDKLLGKHKQQLSLVQMHEMVIDAGFDIGRSTLSEYIRKKREKKQEAFIQQEYELGSRMEYDFGDVKLVISGSTSTYHMAVIASPASDFRWAYLYDNMKKPVFMDSHVRFFEMIGGVPSEMVYDNMKNVVKRFIGKNEKELNPDLVKMGTYYGFDINVTNCYSGNEKGYVESNVKKLQKKVFSKRYEFDSFEEAEEYLQEKLIELNENSRIEEEKECLRPYVPPLELGELCTLKVNKYSFIQVENNQYSVPEHLVGHWVKAKIYPKEILVYSDSRLVATHKKIDGYHKVQVDIYHYLETLEKKPGALKNSTALKSKNQLKTIYDNHFSKRTKEFIAILRDNQDKTYPQLCNILKESADITSSSKQCADDKEDNVVTNTKKQIAKLSAMFKIGGSGYVN